MDREQVEEEVDALCPECGHAFGTYINRFFRESEETPETLQAECSLRGRGECKIGK